MRGLGKKEGPTQVKEVFEGGFFSTTNGEIISPDDYYYILVNSKKKNFSGKELNCTDSDPLMCVGEKLSMIGDDNQSVVNIEIGGFRSALDCKIQKVTIGYLNRWKELDLHKVVERRSQFLCLSGRTDFCDQ